MAFDPPAELPTDEPDSPPPGFTVFESATPFAALIGPVYECLEPDRVRRGFRVQARLCNRLGIVHGGMLTSFADILLGDALWRAGHGPAVTVRLSCDFLGPARQGDWVEGEAHVLACVDGTVHVEGTVSTRGHAVLAARGVFRQVRRRD